MTDIGLPSIYHPDEPKFECAKCHIEKVALDFYLNSRYTNGLSSYCKLCMKDYGGVWKRDNPPEKGAWKSSYLMRKYGITLDQYNEMFDAQKGLCRICDQSSEKALSVDHCHKTKVVRGLLCDNCNHGIGKFKDSVNLLLAAAEYLKETACQ